MLTCLVFRIAVNDFCRDWVMFLRLAPPCAVQTRLVLQGRSTYPTSRSMALLARESTWLSCSARCCTCSTSHLHQCLTLQFNTTNLWWALHWTSCLLSDPWMLFKCYDSILCARDKFLKQLVKGIIQVVSVSLVYLTMLFGMAQVLILLHNFQD